jgi:hypothetical protein
MSYIHMELLVKPEILTSYIYGPTFGRANYSPHMVITVLRITERVMFLRLRDSLSSLAGGGTVEERTPLHMVRHYGALERAIPCCLCS